MYKKVSTDLNFVEREKEVIEFWKKNDIFKKSIKAREGHPTFMFYDGPPTANGKPHIGHIETRVFKDVVPRYWTMKGYEVPRKAGWDTHGLPVELEVEKLLGIDGKPEIEKYGVEPSNENVELFRKINTCRYLWYIPAYKSFLLQWGSDRCPAWHIPHPHRRPSMRRPLQKRPFRRLLP